MIDQLIQFLELRPWLAYATVFAAALLEAVPVLGSFVPGSSIIIGLSAFVAAGELKLAGVFSSAIAGALIGDGSAFLIGHIHQRQILNMWPLKSYPNIIARSERYFVSRGMLAVLFARFVPPVRAFLPVTAGALGMRPALFYPVNILAIAMWACAHILPGAFAGALWRDYGREVEHIVLPIVVIAVVIAIAAWFVRWRRAVTTG